MKNEEYCLPFLLATNADDEDTKDLKRLEVWRTTKSSKHSVKEHGV
jgi:hypothetical protein